MTPPRLASKRVREMHAVVLSLGYTLKQQQPASGHLAYEHSTQPDFTMSSTPSDRHWETAVTADLKRRHPAAFKRRKSANRQSRRARRRSRVRRPPASVALLLASCEPRPEPVAPVLAPFSETPNPGSPDAIDQGCWCPVYENRRGLGLEGRDGIYAYVAGCPIHDEASEEAA